MGFPDPETHPLLQNWISHQLSQKEVVIQRLQNLRSKSLSQQNRRRKPHRFIPNKFALIHKDRFPNQKHLKIATPWLGPFRIIEVTPTTITVMASASLGGIIKVSTSLAKNCSDLIESDPKENDPDFEENSNEQEFEEALDQDVAVSSQDVE